MNDWGVPEVGEPFQGRIRCCEDDFGGSHWHCGRCGRVSSIYGHLTSGIYHRGEWIPFPDGKSHFTCDSETQALIERMTASEEDTRIL